MNKGKAYLIVGVVLALFMGSYLFFQFPTESGDFAIKSFDPEVEDDVLVIETPTLSASEPILAPDSTPEPQPIESSSTPVSTPAPEFGPKSQAPESIPESKTRMFGWVPVFQETHCPGTDVDPHLVQMNDELVACLIEAGQSVDPPLIISGQTLDPEITELIEQALSAGRNYVGNWGPLIVIPVQIGDPDGHEIAEKQCQVRAQYGSNSGPPLEECIQENTDFYSRFDCCGAVHDPPEPISPVRIQYITYSGAEEMAEEGTLRKITLHEYMHVFQTAQEVHPHELRCSDEENVICEFGSGPVWIEEGSAEFFGLYWADELGWNDRHVAMRENLDSARRVRSEWGISLRDVETRKRQAAVNAACECGGMLYYETGTWATQWLVSRSGVDAFLVDYFPRVAFLGWEVAFEEAFGMTIGDFYTEFDKFLDQPREVQLALLDQASISEKETVEEVTVKVRGPALPEKNESGHYLDIEVLAKDSIDNGIVAEFNQNLGDGETQDISHLVGEFWAVTVEGYIMDSGERFKPSHYSHEWIKENDPNLYELII